LTAKPAKNYEEGDRTVVARRGDATYIAPGSNPQVIASLRSSEELKTFIKVDDCNSYYLIVRGNLMIHVLNGHIISEGIDGDRIHRRFGGLIGVHGHVGPPMKIEYRQFCSRHSISDPARLRRSSTDIF
jgi:hypothetical protein